MRYIADGFYLLAGLALAPMVFYRALRHGRYRQGWKQRFGYVSRRRPQCPCIWIHAVSLGETNAARGIVTELQKQYPDHEIVISSTTDTGYAQAQKLFAETCSIFYFPMDFTWIMARAFRRLTPRLCLLMELEVWPNFTTQAQRHNIPVVVVNGRISDKSYKTYRRFRHLLRPTFSRLTMTLAQTETYAERFRALGCPSSRVKVTGSLKYDTAQVTDSIPGAEIVVQQLSLDRDRPIWVAGGTGTDEEPLILAAHRHLLNKRPVVSPRLILVPRKPERFELVAQMIEQAGFACQRYSPIKKEGQAPESLDPNAVILGDTMGDLRKFYSLATVVFVGRSLVPMGGSDMMEAAALGKPTLFGPFTQNFQQTVDALLESQGAKVVQDAETLAEAVHDCLTKTNAAGALGQRGREVIIANQGATERTLFHLGRILG